MDDSAFFQLNVAVEKSLNQTILRKAELEVSLTWMKPSVSNRIDGILLLIIIYLVIGQKIIRLSASSIWKVTRNKKRLSYSNSYQLPCKNCQFFSNNRILKCAVHPTTVLTNQALNCSDYLFQLEPLVPPKSVVTATVFDPQTQSWYHLPNLFENSASVWAVVPFLRPHATPTYRLLPSEVKGALSFN